MNQIVSNVSNAIDVPVQSFSKISNKINVYQDGLIFSYIFLFFCGIVCYIEFGLFFF